MNMETIPSPYPSFHFFQQWKQLVYFPHHFLLCHFPRWENQSVRKWDSCKGKDRAPWFLLLEETIEEAWSTKAWSSWGNAFMRWKWLRGIMSRRRNGRNGRSDITRAMMNIFVKLWVYCNRIWWTLGPASLLGCLRSSPWVSRHRRSWLCFSWWRGLTGSSLPFITVDVVQSWSTCVWISMYGYFYIYVYIISFSPFFKTGKRQDSFNWLCFLKNQFIKQNIWEGVGIIKIINFYVSVPFFNVII